jgi:hypothetical protein
VIGQRARLGHSLAFHGHLSTLSGIPSISRQAVVAGGDKGAVSMFDRRPSLGAPKRDAICILPQLEL